MQITFFTTKENFIKLFCWIKENIEDVVFIDSTNKEEFNSELLYSGGVGYGKQIFLTTREIFNKMKELSIVESYKCGVELYICYSDEAIYTSDYTMYNPYKCKYHNGIVGNYRLKMLVSNDSFSFCYNLIMEVITNEKRYL